MIKFKIGDKVVPFQNLNDSEYDNEIFRIYQGKTGIIKDYSDLPDVEFEDSNVHVFHQEELELEEIYNSPLYKALREE